MTYESSCLFSRLDSRLKHSGMTGGLYSGMTDMREISYKEFSRDAHKKNMDCGRFSDCQFELTFGCDYNCRHCYTACYNKKNFLSRELKTEAVKAILNKLRRAGVLWLCWTGGDPLKRNDFAQVYDYAARMGFIITVFTNGFRVTPDIVRLWQDRPPFLVEITLNAVSQGLYEKISGLHGSFLRVMAALDSLKRAGIRVKLKMQVTRQNYKELSVVKAFAAKRNLIFEPSFLIHPRLNGDKVPRGLRVPLPRKDFSGIQENAATQFCNFKTAGLDDGEKPFLFPCAIGSGARLYIDPHGDGFLCCFLRQPKYNLSNVSVSCAREAALGHIRGCHYSGAAVCPSCEMREKCIFCPGLAYLETGNPEAVVKYYCRLAQAAYNKIC